MDIQPVNTPVHRFSHEAMATVNTVEIAHDNATYARQVSTVLFDEMDRLVGILSHFEEGSDIWQINHASSSEPISICRETYECLAISIDIADLTQGAFDISAGPLVDLWKHGEPKSDEVERALARVGLSHLALSPNSYTVSVLTPGVALDLGGIGKGYIIDKLAEFLEDWDVPRVLFNSGGSSMLALSPPSDDDAWRVTCGQRTLELNQMAVSASGIGYQGLHIIDPKTGHPVNAKTRCWVMAPTAAIADAMSTAAMIMTKEELSSVMERFPVVSFIGQEDDHS